VCVPECASMRLLKLPDNREEFEFLFLPHVFEQSHLGFGFWKGAVDRGLSFPPSNNGIKEGQSTEVIQDLCNITRVNSYRVSS
jgi:hypothetical protein